MNLCKLGFILLMIFFLNIPQAFTQELTIDSASKTVDVTTGFEGAEITIFGTASQGSDIAIILKGPEKRIVLRRKQEVFGVWMNRENMDFRRIPLFYDYAVSKSEQRIAPPEILRAQNIGINNISFEADSNASAKKISEFQEALIRTKQNQGLYSSKPQSVQFVSSSLFRASFYLPASVPIGRYSVEGLLFQNGELLSTQNIFIDVRPKGLAAKILFYATNYSILYGLTALGIALFAGFLSFFMFRRER